MHCIRAVSAPGNAHLVDGKQIMERKRLLGAAVGLAVVVACGPDASDRRVVDGADGVRPAFEHGDSLQTPLPQSAVPQFVQPLPLLTVQGGPLQTVSGERPLTLRMCEFRSRILPPGTLGGTEAPETWVWGYVADDACPTGARDTYIGPVVVATRGVPTEVLFENNLPNAGASGVVFYRNSLDRTLDWADPENDEANLCDIPGFIPAFGSFCASQYTGPVPAVTHLHGGEVPAQLDGGPFSWFTGDGAHQGSGYYTAPFRQVAGNQAVYRYPNVQEAAPLWFHDHAMGVTRLNVYAGLAGVWLLTDPALNLPPDLPAAAETVPLVLQDRMFDTNGQLFYQANTNGGIQWAPNPDHPYWAPEMIGDVIVVNGKAWPYLDVEPRRYRFLLLNGSQARTFELYLEDEETGQPGPSLHVIASDGGYLDFPAEVDPQAGGRLLMMPGERYEVLVDFGALSEGTRLVLRNTAANPFPDGDAPEEDADGRIVQFRVGCGAGGCPADLSFDPAGGTPLRTGTQAIRRLADPVSGSLAAGTRVDATRQLTLNEVVKDESTVVNPVTGELIEYEGGPLEVLLNNSELLGMHQRAQDDFVTVSLGNLSLGIQERPREGTTEVWEFVNLTADAHPIHLHLIQFQVLNRQPFDLEAYEETYAAAFPAVPGRPECTGGVYCPEYGPPLDYRAGNPRALGGNPDVVPFLMGPAAPPEAWEAGWKDTVIVPPGAVTRLVARWAPVNLPVDTPSPDLYFAFDPSAGPGYVWHCHILDHEDNEMMRPYRVLLNPEAPKPPLRPYVQGVDY